MFSKFFRPAKSAVAVPTPRAAALPYTRLTLDDWRNSPERVAYVGELFKQPLFLDLVGMLSNIRPMSRGALDATTAAKLLGQREGHDQVIATLMAAGKSPEQMPSELPPADYAAENVMAGWDKEGDMSEQR